MFNLEILIFFVLPTVLAIIKNSNQFFRLLWHIDRQLKTPLPELLFPFNIRYLKINEISGEKTSLYTFH